MNLSSIRVIAGFWTALLVAVPLHVGAQKIKSAAPHPIFIGQPVQEKEVGQWAEAEGVVTFVGKHGDEISLELSSGAGHMLVTVAGANDNLPELLLKSRIRAEGRCIGLRNSINGEIEGSLSTPSRKEITILQLPQEIWQRYPLRTIADFTGAMRTNLTGKIVRLRGKVRKTNDGALWLADGTGEIKIHPMQALPKKLTDEIEMLGTVTSEDSKVIFQSEVSRVIAKEKNKTSALPILTTTEQVRWLKPEEANWRYPVKLRAVVTFVFGPTNETSGNLQDGTGGIYAWHLVSSGTSVKPGDFCEVEGETSAGAFSPGIVCRKLTVLGEGQFPEPARPNWDELASGSLDAQWVEIEGVVLSTAKQHLEIRTQGVRLSCFVPDGDDLGHFLNAVVLVRGVVVADWDQSRHVQGLHLNLPSEEFISLETPPQDNPFSLPTKQIKDLLFYDPGESDFRREKIAGEIIAARDGVYYLMNGTNGLRLLPKDNVKLVASDTVEAVGFPEIDNSTAPPLLTLWEAVVRTTGQNKPMPAAVKISPDDLLNSEHDSTLVQLEARVIHFGTYGANQVMELQAGARTFFARLDTAAGQIPQLPPGSRVEITGAYVFNNVRSNGRLEAGPFELLLNSPGDVRVLEWPSWWTTEHALTVVSGMAVLILLGLIWIALLRQQVGRRTAQLSTANRSLEAEIAERKRTENELVQTRSQHLIEQERTRIARDIHDELGSSLSQIRLLSEMTLSQNDAAPETRSNSGKISAKALDATRTLDEIVWAVDPQNDTLESLLTYLFNFASDYLSLAGIRFRIDAPVQISRHALTTQIRHQLYMAFKETLTNIVNHSRATEVWIRLRLEAGSARFIIEDNGCGFDLSDETIKYPGASGLDNMKKRFNEIGGNFTLESAPDKGTRVEFILPLAQTEKS